MRTMVVVTAVLTVALAPVHWTAAGETPVVAETGSLFADLPVVDEVRCAEAQDAHDLAESVAGVSRVEAVLGQACRVLPNEGGSKYFAYRLGKGKGLKVGAAYVLEIQFPEDRPRSMFIINRGDETTRGVYTGPAVGDMLHGRYVNSNPESLRVPLSGQYQTWRTLFWLHDRFPDIKLPRDNGERPFTPADGFWVIVAQSKASNDPLSAGAAVSRIRLLEVPNAGKYDLQIRYPEDLPRRRLFWREEMADGVIASRDPAKRGVTRDADWYEYKARLCRFLGINTFSTDLLEFGHNQGWDSSPYGGSDWYNQSATPQRWGEILAVAKRHGLDVLPYYEYCGSIGQKTSLGTQKRCLPLNGKKDYTHITWTEIANADVTDPDTLVDAKQLLDCTIVRHRDEAKFVGAWFRTRPSQWPISFSNRCLDLFAKEANEGTPVTREQLRADEQLRGRYYRWWFGKRKQFLIALRDYVREKVGPEAMVLFTAESSEGGESLPGGGAKVVTDDVAAWQEVAGHAEHKGLGVVSLEEVLQQDLYLKAITSLKGTWGDWEWQHACPPADPENYRDVDGVVLTYPFNRAYTVGSGTAFDAYRTRSGIAAIRHYYLNEDEIEGLTGYFVSDTERPGPACMLAEARAVAYGDPWQIGYLASSSFTRGFPEQVRAFNAAFLALPAMPSEVVKDGCDDPEVVVRMIRTEGKGAYVAVVNVGLTQKDAVKLKLPVGGAFVDAVTGHTLRTGADGTVTVTLGPCMLRTLKGQ